jgi:uncharacterized membrane protein
LIVDEVRDLGTLSGHTWSEAHAINEIGAIAGSSESDAGTRRAVWWSSPTAPAVSLGHLRGGWSEAWGMNDSNVVVGNSRASGLIAVRGFRWTQGSGMGGNGGYLLAWVAALVPFCPAGHSLRDSSAKAINDDWSFTGQVHCIGGPGPAPYQGTVSAFTTLLAGYSEPKDQGYGINAAGRVVGGYTVIGLDSEWPYHAFRWSSIAGSWTFIRRMTLPMRASRAESTRTA